jgi:hypothetical protein
MPDSNLHSTERGAKAMSMNEQSDLSQCELEAELRQVKAFLSLVREVSVRRYKQIAELKVKNDAQDAALKACNDFIELQSQRLLNARNHVLRVRKACDLDPL